MRIPRQLRVVSLAGLLALTLAAGPARAEENLAGEGGLGVAAVATSLLYGPVKVVYATLGLVFGGAAWALSGGDTAVMQAVITPAVRGDYVVTPEVLRMERDLEFFGRDPRYRESELVAEIY